MNESIKDSIGKKSGSSSIKSKSHIEYSKKPYAVTYTNDTTSEYESDDSYARDFSQLIKSVKVNTKTSYSSSKSNKINDKNCNLFKIVILRNKNIKLNPDKKHKASLFLTDCRFIPSDRTTTNQNEIFCYWNDEQNKLENNDQLLSINGIYFDQFDFDKAYKLLSTYFVTNTNKTHQKPTAHSNRHIELLIARNINRQIVKKYQQLKKPSCDSIHSVSETQVSSLLFYDQNDDSIFIGSQMKKRDKIMVLNTEWTQLETIELLNETNAGYLQAVLPGNGKEKSGLDGNNCSMSTGSGFGFGITGNKSTGVVVKAITIGGSAYKDGRLRINDQIFQIGDTNVRSMSSEQVASVLRQSTMHGKRITFIVARPVHNNITDIELVRDTDSYELKAKINDLNSDADYPNSESFILKTNDIMDKNVNLIKKLDIEKQKRMNHALATTDLNKPIEIDIGPTKNDTNTYQNADLENDNIQEKEFGNDLNAPCEMPVKTSTPIRQISESNVEIGRISENTALVETMIETEQFDDQSLVFDRPLENLSLNKTLDKAILDVDKTLKIDDEVESESTNNQNVYTVKLIKNKRSESLESETNKKIENILVKKDSEETPTNEILHSINLRACNIFLKENYNVTICYEKKSQDLDNLVGEKTTCDNSTGYYFVKEMQEATTLSESFVIEFQSIEPYNLVLEINSKSIHKYVNNNCFCELESSTDRHITFKLARNMDLIIYMLKQKWKRILDESHYLFDDPKSDLCEDDYEIIVSRIDKTKTKSLGFSLEGTVDIDDNGVETCAHHYIRSIMQNGPTDKAIPFKLEPGDELLEIDSKKLYAINYLDLLNILKALSYKFVTIVCARKKREKLLDSNKALESNDQQINKKLSVRAKSEGFLKQDNSDNKSEINDMKSSDTEENQQAKISVCVSVAKSTPDLNHKNTTDSPRMSRKTEHSAAADRSICLPRSRSLEQNCLAMWQQKITYIKLVKSKNGLGFSLIDYQHNQFTPMSKTMIVIRALVPSGVAQVDGKLKPGQRLVSVNNVGLDDDLAVVKDGATNEIGVLDATKDLDKTNLLSYTVAVLKSLPIGGEVRLGVQKPLPYPESIDTIRPPRAKSQHFNKTESSKICTAKNVLFTEPLPRKRKKKNLKRRKKIISTSQYGLKSDDESEAFTQLEDNAMKKNKNVHMLKRLNVDLNDKKESHSRSEYEETENSTALKDESSMTMSSGEEKTHKTVDEESLVDQTLTSAFGDESPEPHGYSLAATSAPAILNDLEALKNQQKNQKHSFYSTSSLLKSQTSLLGKRTKSDFDIEKINGQKINLEVLPNENVQSDDEKSKPIVPANHHLNIEKRESNISIQDMVLILQNSDIPFTVSNVDEVEEPLADELANIYKSEKNRKTSETKIVNSEQLLNKLMTQQAEEIHLKQKNTQAMDFIDDECIIMDKIYGDDNNNSINNNKQLITEEQFQTALIINASKKNLNFNELITNSTEDLTNNEQMNIYKDCESDQQMMESNEKVKGSKSTKNETIKSHKKSKKSKLLELESMLVLNQDINNELRAKSALVSDLKKKRSSSAKNIESNKHKSKSSSSEHKKHRKDRRSPSITDSRSLHGDCQEPTAFGNYSLSRTVPTSTTNMASRVPSRCSSVVKVLNILGADIVKFPTVLEKEVKIKKNFDPLGITMVDCFIDHGINGCAILKIDPNSACSRDKTLDCGDYLLTVNNENMRNVSNSKARSILNRASLTSSDVTIRYISLDEAIAYVEDLNKTYKYSFPVNNKLYQTHKRQVTLAQQESKSISSDIGSSTSTSSMSLSLSMNSLNSLGSSQSLCNEEKFFQESDIIREFEIKKLTDKQKVQLDPRLQNKIRLSRSEASELESKKKNIAATTTKGKNNYSVVLNDLELTQRSGKESLDSLKLKNKANSKSKSKTVEAKEYDQDTDDYGDYCLNKSKTTESLISPPTTSQQVTKNYAQSTKLEKISSESVASSRSLMSPVLDELASSIWGPARKIVLKREPNKSLGISIVGGKLDISIKDNGNEAHQDSNFISGIFIKHVLENSPAGINGTLHTGDRILAVGGIDLTSATHDRAVEVIRNSKSPIEFLIQSLLINESVLETGSEEDNRNNMSKATEETNLSSTDNQCSHDTTATSETDMTDFDHQFYDDNYYNYNLNDLKIKYGHLINGEMQLSPHKANVLIFRLERQTPNQSLGLSLSGNNDHSKTSVFVCDITTNSPAAKYGSFKVGDQILEINGKVIYGRAHCNVTPIVKSINELIVYVVVLRNQDHLRQMSLSKYTRYTPSDSEFNNETNNSDNHAHPEVNSPSKACKKPIEPVQESNETKASQETTNKKVLFKSKERSKSASSKSTSIKLVTLKKGPAGFGIAISEDRHHRLIIRGLNPTGIAQKDGRLQIGDEIIKVNSLDVKLMNYDEIMNLLHSTEEPVEFCIKRSDASKENENTATSADLSVKLSSPQANSNMKHSPSASASNIKNSEAMSLSNDNPRSDSIRLCQETWIEIERGKMGLGLSIVGGSDTQLQGIIIHDIYQTGAAFADKRLAIGDQILKVNGIDLTNATHEQALNALRQTSDYVRLLVYRGFLHSCNDYDDASKNQQVFENKSYYRKNFVDDEQYLNVLTIDLMKKFAKGLGFSIIGRRDGSGVFLSHIIEGGCAHKDGRLMVGDLLLEVNGQDIRMSPYNDVAFLLKTLPQGKVSLKIGRFKTSACQSQSSSTNTSNKNSRRNSITKL